MSYNEEELLTRGYTIADPDRIPPVNELYVFPTLSNPHRNLDPNPNPNPDPDPYPNPDTDANPDPNPYPNPDP